MGTELTDAMNRAKDPVLSLLSALDARTSGLIRAIIDEVAARHSEFRAAILYGSVARGEERPLTDPVPSDVDLLLLFDVEPGQADIPYPLYRAIFASIGEARQRYLYPPREVQALPAASDLRGWDAAFIANVACDGILLFARGPLPACLAGLASRGAN